MVRHAYNPQEVLSPLMNRLGRHFAGGRAEGLNRMVSVVSDALDVAPNYARELVASLASCGLIDYEAAPPPPGQTNNFATSGPARYVSVAGPASEMTDRTGTLPQCHGVWRVGPSL